MKGWTSEQLAALEKMAAKLPKPLPKNEAGPPDPPRTKEATVTYPWQRTNVRKKQVWVDPKDSERMTMTELEALNVLSYVTAVLEASRGTLAKRLESIPSGKQRMAMTSGGLIALVDDLVGTIPPTQARAIMNVSRDYKLRLVPKMTPESRNLVIDDDTLIELINCGRDRCVNCGESDESCRGCALYQILEALIPPREWEDNGLLCPFSRLDEK